MSQAKPNPTVDDLRAELSAFVAGYADRTGVRHWWREPLLVSAAADDRFDALPRMAAEDHLLPAQLLPRAKSVVAFFLPFEESLGQANAGGDRPIPDWGLAYVQTNQLIGDIGAHLGDYLTGRGFEVALTPATHNFDEVRLVARWSHKHLAYLAGLGRFGHHHQLITPAGCLGRLGSLVTSAELGDHPLIQTEEACLLKIGQKCYECVKACPVAALTGKGLDRPKCFAWLKDNLVKVPAFEPLPDTTHVCGKCAAMMPCSFTNPAAQAQV